MGKKSREKKEARERKIPGQDIELYTIDEVAEILRLSTVTIRKRIRNNQIKSIDISAPGSVKKRHRITRQEVERLIKVS